MKSIKLKIKNKKNIYPIIIGNNLLRFFYKILKKNSLDFNQCLIVVDKKVPKILLRNLTSSLGNKKKYIYFFESSEKNKNFINVNKILSLLLKKNFFRNDCLISIGGGITGDISSFAASIFKRGINFINVPTTLLSQVDSSIGGKTGINTPTGKNLIGTFYQPKLVLSDASFLKSLPRREIICGYAEILKHALILDKKFFLYLYKNGKKILDMNYPILEKAIYQSCMIKKKIVELDENEKSIRKTLNFGHTFGHAYEATSKFSKTLNHGESVLLGMHTAITFAFKKKILSKQNYDIIKNHYLKLNLPNDINKFFSKRDSNTIVNYMIRDKKNKDSNINLVLIKSIGKTNYNFYIKNKIMKNFFMKELIN